MCGFFRAGVYFVFEERKLLPKDENDLHVSVEVNQGLIDMQTLFQGQLHDRVRRKKNHLMSCISFPSDPPKKKVKEALEESVASGEIDIGENIVQREYKRTIFDKSTGQLVVKTVSVFGRKHSLCKIRIKLFEKCKKFMRLNSDSYFENISRYEVIKRLQFLNELIDDTEDLNELKERLKRYE